MSYECLLLAAGEFNPLWIFIVFMAFVAMVLVAFFLRFGSLYVRALLSGCYVGITRIVGMKLRGVNPGTIIDSLIMAHKAGLKLDDDLLESHYLARGNVPNVVRAIIAAEKAGIELIYDRACAIDLAGRDVLDAVRTSVNPRVIECPAQGPNGQRRTIDAVAKDGIQLKARARVTVRASLDRLVGGATEETVIARVGEGIVSAIGSATSYKNVLENPDTISKAVLKRGLDAGTAFDILSIDIADVDVGENIGAKLEADQAEADVRVARAKAEEKRAMAAANVVVNQALVEENRAKVVLAEAEIPQAMAAAFRSGNLGIMDYYNLKNVQADTKMRDSIGQPPTPPPAST
ncbi:MAG: flotillin-like protein FloA [Planctomycetes bacterium]|nr:flotillin-like protein FloA [Planctomycetota bacterium]